MIMLDPAPTWACLASFVTFLIYLSAYIVCVYEDPIVPEQAASVTEKLGDYLIQVDL